MPHFQPPHGHGSPQDHDDFDNAVKPYVRSHFSQVTLDPVPGEAYNLGVGSLIQIPAADGTTKYGTIKWIGFVQDVQGEVAGIEMVKFFSAHI